MAVSISPKDYLLIWALIVTAVVVSFFFRRSQRPTRLNLYSNLKSNLKPGLKSSAGEELTSSKNMTPIRINSERLAEKPLNVFFQWNGHTWDAFEALGLPAGSSLESVRAAYEEVITRGASDDLPFFKAALDAIIRSSPPSR